MTNLDLTLEIKNLEEPDKIYPYCEKSKLFCELLKTQTLTHSDLNIIKKIGFNYVLNGPIITHKFNLNKFK